MTAYFETLRLQLRQVLAFEARDQPKRVILGGFICVVIAFAGSTSGAIVAYSLILSIEFLLRFVHRTTPQHAAEVTTLRLVVVIATHLASITAFCLPGILLVQQPREFALVGGLIWLNAVLIHSFSAYAMVRAFAWLSLIPTCASIFLAVVVRHKGPYPTAGPWDEYLLLFGMVAWVVNVVESMLRQGQNRHSFGEARLAAERQMKHLEHASRHDPLTGLPNRRAFNEAVTDALLTVHETGPITVMLIDLNGFKPINDTYGHAAGDHVLVAVAQRLQDAVPDGQVGRLGGDEFVAVVPGLDDDQQRARALAIQAAISAPIEYENAALAVTASIGFAASAPGDAYSDIIARADRHMYAVKAAQKAHRQTG